MLDFSLARVFEWPLDVHSEIYTYVFPRVLYPLNNIIFNTSIGLTVVVAFERYGGQDHRRLMLLRCVRQAAHFFIYLLPTQTDIDSEKLSKILVC